MNETNDIMKNKVMPALRRIMQNADVNPEVRLLLDTGVGASDELKQSVIDRYIAPYLKDDKNGQLKLLNEMLNATSDKEKFDLLKDFLEGIPVFSQKFDPKKFLEDTSEKIAAGVPGVMPEERTVEAAAQPPRQVEKKEEVDLNARVIKELSSPPPRQAEILEEGDMIPPPPPVPVIMPPRMPTEIEEGSYEKEQIASAGIKEPEMSPQPQPIPGTPMEAKDKYNESLSKNIQEQGAEVAKEIFKPRKAETTTLQAQATGGFFKLNPVKVGVLSLGIPVLGGFGAGVLFGSGIL